MAQLRFIPQANPKSGSNVTLTLDDVPQEVRDDVEEVYKTLKTQPGRMAVEFDTIAELNKYVAQVKAYCDLRPAGAIRFRKSPARNLKSTQMEFRITDLLTENEEITEGIREATENVKTAAKK